MRVHLFGPELRLIHAGSSIATSAAPKTRELLAHLILRAREPVSRGVIAPALWPDVLDSEARQNLRRHLSLLQRYLAPYVDESAIAIESDMLRWNEAAAWVNVYAFERFASAPGAAQAAVEICEADLLDRMDAEWLVVERERLRAKLLSLLTKLMDSAERFGDLPRAIRHASDVLRIDPLREDAVRRLMNYIARSGDRVAALRVFRDFERRLADDFGVEPMPQTRAQHDLLASGTSVTSETEPTAREVLVGRSRDLEGLRDWSNSSAS